MSGELQLDLLDSLNYILYLATTWEDEVLMLKPLCIWRF